MPMHFVCPHCAAPIDIEIDEKVAGQTGPCPRCGMAVTIPTPRGFVSRPPRRRTGMILVVGGLLAVGLLAAVLALWPRDRGLEMVQGIACRGNLQKIAVAMKAYEAANGCFPPAFIADKHGQPMHSWRVLLLPHLGEQDLYERYRFNERWDSAHNRAVTDVTVGLFQCPSQPGTNQPTTNYMLVVGPHTISNGREGRKIADITDGSANTIMVVEVADSATWWAEPKDLHLDQLNCEINGSKRQGISSYHPEGVNVAFCDGSVRLLKNSTSPQLVKAMLTIDGGEPVPKQR